MAEDSALESTEASDSEGSSGGDAEACLSQNSRNRDPNAALQKHWYETTVRLRVAFYVFNALALLLAVSMGWIVHVFFSIMNGEPDGALAFDSHVLPIALLCSAIMVDEMLDFGLDSMCWPSLSVFRATFTTSIHAFSPGFTSWGAELTALIAIEGIPLVTALISLCATRGPITLIGILTSYLVGGLICVFILSIMYVVAHVHVDCSSVRQAQMVDLYRRLGHFGQLRGTKVSPMVVETDEVQICARAWRCTRLVLVAVVLNLVGLGLRLVFHKGMPIEFMLLGELIIVVLGALAINAFIPRLLGKAFCMTFVLFVIFTVVLLIGARKQVVPTKGKSLQPLCLGPLAPGYGAPGDLPLKFQPPLNAEGYGYPVCSEHWGNRNMTVENQLDIFDLAVLAYASSYPSEEAVRSSLDTMFKGTVLASWSLLEVEDASTVGRWIVVEFPMQKVRVVAVRGTSNLRDAYADLDIYAKVSVFQFVSRFTPVLQLLGPEVVRSFVASNPTGWLFGVPKFWERFMGSVARHKQDALAKGFSLVLTGHSLGGALAGAASAQQVVQGVGFSAPGLFYQTKRMGISEQDLQYAFTEIQPSGDAVPRADVQMGAVNWIQCTAKKGTCHSLRKTSCELWSRCGDPRGRDWRGTCSSWYTRTDLNM